MKRQSFTLLKIVVDSKYNFGKFNVISTLFSSVKLDLHNCSHRQPMKQLTHNSTYSTVSIYKDFVMIYSCGLHLGHKKSTKEIPLSNGIIFFQYTSHIIMFTILKKLFKKIM